LIDQDADRAISVVGFMELLQGAADKGETRLIKDFLKECAISVLPLTENIGHRRGESSPSLHRRSAAFPPYPRIAAFRLSALNDSPPWGATWSGRCRPWSGYCSWTVRGRSGTGMARTAPSGLTKKM
jgi:hypothetical protein